MDRFALIVAMLIAILVAISNGAGVRPRCLARSGMGNGMAFNRRFALVGGQSPAGN